MPVVDSETRLERLNMLLRFARQRPQGFTTREVAQELGIIERTARRYIDELAGKGWLPVETRRGAWRLIDGGQIAPGRLHLNLNEAMAMYLAARLFSGYSDRINPHAISAMKKLAGAMPREIGDHIRRTAVGTERRKNDRAHIERLEVLTQAWAERRRVRFQYTGAGGRETSERHVDPYFIEPSAVGYASYLIGHDHTRQAIRIFKIERMRRVELTDERFEWWTDFDPYRYLENAWGIMGGEDMFEVVLRFSPEARSRIRESDWPGVVSVEDDEKGGCVLRLRVSHTLEMTPWIRGWGPDCEVLSPPDLRQRIAADMGRAAAVYGG
jgi:proteasome accessory factor B